MDPEPDPDDALQQQVDDLSCWMPRPNPHHQPRLLLYELVEHSAIAGDALWYLPKDSTAKIIDVRPVPPALTKVVASKHGEVSGYVMCDPSTGETTRFAPEEVLHFRLLSPGNKKPGDLSRSAHGVASRQEPACHLSQVAATRVFTDWGEIRLDMCP